MKDINVILGITGGISAYKAADLASELIKLGANVDVIMTKNAKQFITPLTFETITKNKVYTDMWDRPDHIDVEHISLAKKADIILIAPASANTIGKLANGLADDVLTTTCLAAYTKIKLLAPAMNTQMWENPIVQKNLRTLTENDWAIVSPVEKRLACGDFGMGGLASKADILAKVSQKLGI
jgi:phosphopantothenoylcysteine decarboxylase/phosphopantothenate--cysteine ligase